MLQRLAAKSLYSACTAECWSCICFLLSGQDDKVRHSSLTVLRNMFTCVVVHFMSSAQS